MVRAYAHLRHRAIPTGHWMVINTHRCSALSAQRLQVSLAVTRTEDAFTDSNSSDGDKHIRSPTHCPARSAGYFRVRIPFFSPYCFADPVQIVFRRLFKAFRSLCTSPISQRGHRGRSVLRWSRSGMNFAQLMYQYRHSRSVHAIASQVKLWWDDFVGFDYWGICFGDWPRIPYKGPRRRKLYQRLD